MAGTLTRTIKTKTLLPSRTCLKIVICLNIFVVVIEIEKRIGLFGYDSFSDCRISKGNGGVPWI